MPLGIKSQRLLAAVDLHTCCPQQLLFLLLALLPWPEHLSVVTHGICHSWSAQTTLVVSLGLPLSLGLICGYFIFFALNSSISFSSSALQPFGVDS